MSKGFTMGTVLLVGVGEGRIGPLLHVMQRAGNGRDALDKGTAEGSVSQVERLAPAAVGGWRKGVLTGTAEEEKGEGTQVEDGLGAGLVLGMGEACNEGVEEDGDVDGPHPGGGGVLVRPGLE